MTYVLATTEKIVRWYVFREQLVGTAKITYPEAVDVLDLNIVPMFGDKKTAKEFALANGLQTWRYVNI